jgi:hypothetical protein
MVVTKHQMNTCVDVENTKTNKINQMKMHLANKETNTNIKHKNK